MSVLSPLSRRRILGAIAALTLAVFAASSLPFAAAYADPPPWAPAHGWRAKHKHKGKDKYVAYRPAPFDIGLGRCNRDLLGAVLGGVAGGAIGASVTKGDNRTAGIVGGTIIGAIIGGVIGGSMDRVDQNCVGQALEHAEDGRQVRWRAPNGAPDLHSAERAVLPRIHHHRDRGRPRRAGLWHRLPERGRLLAPRELT